MASDKTTDKHLMPNKKINKTYIIALCALALVAGGAYAIFTALRPTVPNERKMARALADIYTADAVLQEYMPHGAKDKTIEETYHSIFEHYGLTKASYDSAVAYYSRRPKKMSSVYERAVAILSEREAKVKAVADRADSTARAVEAQNDSLTSQLLGSRALTISLPLADKNDTLRKFLKPTPRKYKRVEMSFDLDSLTGGHIDVRQRYTVTKSVETSPAAYVRIVVSYADSTETRDSVRLDAHRRVTQREAELVATLKDSVAAIKADVTFFEAQDLKDMAVLLREMRVYYKPYDVVDTTDYDNLLPSLFAY